MRNFIIFFEEKEGTSPLVRLLNNFERISIIHQVNNRGWEPFDRQACGPMSLGNLERCLDIVFNKASIDFKRLNRIYTRTSALPLEETRSEIGAFGFKMRFTPPADIFPNIKKWGVLNKLSGIFTAYYAQRFKHMMIKVLKKYDVMVFLAVRQDIYRWGLSKYHGDGSGQPGHLQFKLASGKISRNEIGKIVVDCTRLRKILSVCEASHAHKRRLIEELQFAGIQAHPLLYEDFLTDKQRYFSQILNHLEIKTSQGEIDAALKGGAYFKKVHSDDISDFVRNHEEVQEKFGDRFVSWVLEDLTA